MTEEKHRIFGRAADIAKNVLDESAKAMYDESQKIDKDEYVVSDMISTVTRVVNASIAGTTELARIPLEERWPEKHLVLGEYVSTVMRRMVSQAGTVAQAAADDVEGFAYTPRRWLESMTRLIDIAIAGGMDIAETLVAGPAAFEGQPVASASFTVANGTETRELSWDTELRRDATEDKIPAHKIRFDPPTLIPPNNEFRVLVNTSGLVSGVYKGKVRVGKDHVKSVQIAL
jgi:hypothetical protein